MKKGFILSSKLVQLRQEEADNICGGGGIGEWSRCVNGTLTNGFGGGARTIFLGGTIWGMARLMGVMLECANL